MSAEELAGAGFARAFARHLGSLKGIVGGQAIACAWQDAAEGEAPEWRELARLGRIDTAGAEAELAEFDPAAGGTVRPVEGGQGGWFASYSSAGPGVHLLVRLALGPLQPAELQAVLSQVEQRMGWLLVEAARATERQQRSLVLSTEASAAILLGASEAANRTALADQWIARLERALAVDLIGVCWLVGHRPQLGSISGGGVIQQPGRQRSAIEALAGATVEARSASIFKATEGRIGQALHELGAAQAVCLPVYEGDPCRAVMVLLWRDADAEIPDENASDLISRVLGEALTIQSRAHPALALRLRNWLLATGTALFGARALKLKLALLVIALALVIGALIPSRHSPAFAARIEARDRLLVAAPFDGFLAESPVQLGDRVSAGAVLMRMEDNDLRLEGSRLAAEAEQLANAVQTARAGRDTAAVRDLDARLGQNRVQTALVESQLARASVTAARAALVIGGDAARRVGGRVRLGESLIELATVHSLAVQVFIDEDWVAALPESAEGELLLSAWPDRPIPVTLERITSEAQQVEGSNAFVGWMRFDLPGDLPLMDGMRGIVRVDAGATSLLGRYGRGVGRWVSRTLWRWN